MCPAAKEPAKERREKLQALAQLKLDAEGRADVCHWGARRYRYSYLRWNAVALWLLLGGAVTSFLASAALLTNLAKHHRTLSVILGFLSLLAGLLQVLYSVTDARKRAEDFAQGQRWYELMRSHYRRFALTWSDPDSAAAKFDELLEEEEDKLSLPRPMEAWTLAKVEREFPDQQRPEQEMEGEMMMA